VALEIRIADAEYRALLQILREHGNLPFVGS
jgi:hypothetical protein